MKKLYFDYAATTSVAPGVRMAMEPYLSEKFGNPGSIHFFGQLAAKAVDEAREKILKIIGAPAENFRGLIFTGSAEQFGFAWRNQEILRIESRRQISAGSGHYFRD
jgi:cysteine desulfurase